MNRISSIFSPASLAWLGYIHVDYGRLLYMYPRDATVDLRFVEDILILIHSFDIHVDLEDIDNRVPVYRSVYV